jgi:NADPH:quinone reductase-like Zn-dependent oxidoreductase
MQAITQRVFGGPDVLELATVDVPAVGPGDVRVRVRAAGVDRGASHLMRGLPLVVRLTGSGMRRPKVQIPGTNIAGVVDAVGAGVTRFSCGDDMYGTCVGAFAEYAVTRPDRLAPVPTTLGYEQAAVLPYAGIVSLQALRDRAHVRPGERVLIVGASGAVGTVGVQIARALGARVTGVCGAERAALVTELGADRVIDYRREDFADGSDRYDVVLDIGGNTPVRRLRATLERGGRLVIIGGEGGGPILGGIQRQLGATVASLLVRQKLGTIIAREDGSALDDLSTLVQCAGISPVLGRAYALDETPDAMRALDRGGTGGRLVITP